MSFFRRSRSQHSRSQMQAQNTMFVMSYTLVDTITGSTYIGRFRLGRYRKNGHSEIEADLHLIGSWITELSLIRGDNHYLFLKWEPPLEQRVIDPALEIGYNYLSVEGNLQLPLWLGNACNFQIKDQLVSYFTIPKEAKLAARSF